jgi:hypothetical protein
MNSSKNLLFLLFFFLGQLHAQQIEKEAPSGFDQARDGISHGKIDTINYASKTVGNDRKALVYTPPGFSKNEKYPEINQLHGKALSLIHNKDPTRLRRIT